MRLLNIVSGVLLVEVTLATRIKNVIYVVPDGFGTASQVLARDFDSLLLHGENITSPVTYQLAVDKMVRSNMRGLMKGKFEG